MGLLDSFTDVVSNDVDQIKAVSAGILPGAAADIGRPIVMSNTIPGSGSVSAGASTTTVSPPWWQTVASDINAIAPSVQNMVNGLHPTVRVTGDVAGTIRDAKAAMPWWLLPAGAGLVLLMLLKPSGGSRRRY